VDLGKVINGSGFRAETSVMLKSSWEAPAPSPPEASFYLQIERCAGVAKQSCSVRLEEDIKWSCWREPFDHFFLMSQAWEVSREPFFLDLVKFTSIPRFCSSDAHGVLQGFILHLMSVRWHRNQLLSGALPAKSGSAQGNLTNLGKKPKLVNKQTTS